MDDLIEMCGIAGKVCFNNSEVSERDLILMCNKIIHRGPDDFGYFVSKEKKVGLGNRRLAIIDLSSKGRQPMFYKNRYVITTNGEIYNYKEEREKLKKLGYKFKSDCDTEVILALYDRFREKCLNHLRGMFAFAIYDQDKKTLFLARDRIGKKPLKYYFSNGVFIFASEIKAIHTQKEPPRQLDYNAIGKYLVYGYIPSPLTGFKEIKKLPPGHYIKIDLSRKSFVIKNYWEPLFNKKLVISEDQWCKKIIETLTESVSLRMVSDVPLGVFLSGGVDSSAVVATMASLSKNPIKTFTVTFKDKVWDESKFALNVVKRYKTEHIELPVSPQNIEILPTICQNFEEPFADSGMVLSYLVSKLAKRYVTVILNGDGGDEIFAGYPNRHFRLKRDVDYFEYINILRPAAAFGLKAINKVYKNTSIKKIENFFEKSKLPLYQRFASYNQVFSAEDLLRITKGSVLKAIKENNPFEEVEECFRLFKGKDLKDAGLKFDLLYWLPDDLLAKADMSSMANSLEARSPLLDTKMLELTGQIPFNLKVKNGEGKYIFKKALEKMVPKKNLYHPKRGFGLPLHTWFYGKTKTYTKSILLSKNAKTKDLIEQKEIKLMFDSHNLTNDFGPKLWSLLTLELWFRNNFS